MTPTADKILDVAQSLIVAGGYNGFSYADISAAIGIRKASIHHHFPTKAELVGALLERYWQQAEAGLGTLQEHFPDPAQRLQAYLNFWRGCIEDASLPYCLCAMLAGEMQMLPDEVAQRVRAYFHGLAGWLSATLQAGAEQGVLRLDGQPEKEAQALMALVHGAMLSARAQGEPGLFATITAAHAARLQAADGAAGTPR